MHLADQSSSYKKAQLRRVGGALTKRLDMKRRETDAHREWPNAKMIDDQGTDIPFEISVTNQPIISPLSASIGLHAAECAL